MKALGALAASRWTWMLLALLLLAAALAAPFNHDEDQYYAAAELARGAMPYRDFMYLQTPLFVWWGALIASIAPDHLLIAGRVGQALLALLSCVLVWRSCLQLTQDRRAAAFAVILMAASHSFTFSATVYRNDMLPVLLECCALTAILPYARDPRSMPLLAPLLCGGFICLAASTKVTFGVIGLAPLVWLLIVRGLEASRRLALLAMLAFGALIGLVPTLGSLMLVGAEQLVWQIVTFNADAPLHWFELTGRPDWMEQPRRFFDWLANLAMGPQLLLLALIGWHRLIGLRQRKNDGDRAILSLLDLFVLFALIASVIPNPSWRQYFVVLAPVLVLRLPFVLSDMGAAARKWTMRALWLFVAVGVIVFAVVLTKHLRSPARSVMARTEIARWIGDTVRTEGLWGPVATLSPHLVVDSGLPLDPAFAPGPFVFRWSDPAVQEVIADNGGVTATLLERHFAANPPAAIVTGYESGAAGPPEVDLDAALRCYAQQRGYRLRESPVGSAMLYLAPPQPVSPPAMKTSCGPE